MVKPRRSIKFNHRSANGHSSSADGRRSSFSDISEVASEPGSPVKLGANGDITIDVRSIDIRDAQLANILLRS